WRRHRTRESFEVRSSEISNAQHARALPGQVGGRLLPGFCGFILSLLDCAIHRPHPFTSLRQRCDPLAQTDVVLAHNKKCGRFRVVRLQVRIDEVPIEDAYSYAALILLLTAVQDFAPHPEAFQP